MTIFNSKINNLYNYFDLKFTFKRKNIMIIKQFLTYFQITTYLICINNNILTI